MASKEEKKNMTAREKRMRLESGGLIEKKRQAEQGIKQLGRQAKGRTERGGAVN